MLFGNDAFHLLAEIGWREARTFLEDMREVGLFVESEFEADLGNRLIGGDEQIFRFNQFAGLDDLRNALMKNLLADQVQIPDGHEEFVSIKMNTLRFTEMSFEDLQEVLEGLVAHHHDVVIVHILLPPFRFNDGEKRI